MIRKIIIGIAALALVGAFATASVEAQAPNKAAKKQTVQPKRALVQPQNAQDRAWRMDGLDDEYLPNRHRNRK